MPRIIIDNADADDFCPHCGKKILKLGWLKTGGKDNE